jgi:hypothetical protein
MTSVSKQAFLISISGILELMPDNIRDFFQTIHWKWFSVWAPSAQHQSEIHSAQFHYCECILIIAGEEGVLSATYGLYSGFQRQEHR